MRAAIRRIGVAHTVGNHADFIEKYHKNILLRAEDCAPVATKILQQRLPHIPLRRVPHYARLGLMAALDALAPEGGSPTATAATTAAGIPFKDTAGGFLPADTALVIGTAYASSKMGLDFMDSILDGGPRLSSPTAFSHAVNNMGAGLLSLYLGLRGVCQTVTQFSLSFAGALHTACLLLHSNLAQNVLVGGIEECDARFLQACAPAASGGLFAGNAAPTDFLPVEFLSAEFLRTHCSRTAEARADNSQPSDSQTGHSQAGVDTADLDTYGGSGGQAPPDDAADLRAAGFPPSGGSIAPAPCTEGAVFLLLSLPCDACPSIRVTWHAQPSTQHQDTDDTFNPPAHAALYGRTALAHAMETVLMAEAVRSGTAAHLTSTCYDSTSGRSAAIHVCT